jgi:molybdopterin synthase sulfur carrier subunit
MKVNFYATLRQITGTKTVEVPTDEPLTVRQLVDRLIQTYPGLKPELVDPEGCIYQHIHILVNGRDYQWLDSREDAKINETDLVNIFPAVGGG